MILALVLDLRQSARDARRVLRLSPLQKVLRLLRQRGYALDSMDALEVYGEAGAFHLKDYARRVNSLEIWEVDPRHEASLHRNFPRATIRIVDSYERVKTAPDRFDLVVVDNPMSRHGSHFEHFDLFPHVFRLVREGGVLIVDVIPRATPKALKRFPYLLDEDHLAARRSFYGTDRPDHLLEADLVTHYSELARAVGRQVAWSFLVQRHFVHYLVLGLYGTPND